MFHDWAMEHLLNLSKQQLLRFRGVKTHQLNRTTDSFRLNGFTLKKSQWVQDSSSINDQRDFPDFPLAKSIHRNDAPHSTVAPCGTCLLQISCCGAPMRPVARVYQVPRRHQTRCDWSRWPVAPGEKHLSIYTFDMYLPNNTFGTVFPVATKWTSTNRIGEALHELLCHHWPCLIPLAFPGSNVLMRTELNINAEVERDPGSFQRGKGISTGSPIQQQSSILIRFLCIKPSKTLFSECVGSTPCPGTVANKGIYGFPTKNVIN